MQRMTLIAFASLGLSLGACDSGGGGGETDSGTGSSSSTTETPTSETTPTSESASDSNSESDSNSGTSTTTSGGDTSTGGGDSSGGSGSTGGGSSSGSTGSTGTTGGEADGIYGPCPGDMACPGDYTCEQIGGGPFVGANWCTQECDVEANDCPDPAEGDATPICRGAFGPDPGKVGVCQLNCTDKTTCPTDMECMPVGPQGGFCAFPADF